MENALVGTLTFILLYYCLSSDNKLLDIFPKHQLFYIMGAAYGVMFSVMGFFLMHPTIGLQNTKADPSRILGWVSYCTIESFGSMVVQCYWALVNSSVDVNFAKKNFGFIIAGAQIGSILGPTVATQAASFGVPKLYLVGAAIMFFMVGAMYLYIRRFGVAADEQDNDKKGADTSAKKKSGKEEGVMEGFYLFYEHDYVKGIFAISSFFMVQVTVIDYMMKVLAKERYATLYPDDPEAALRGFATFMGYFGQVDVNTILRTNHTYLLIICFFLCLSHSSSPNGLKYTEDNELDFVFVFIVRNWNGHQAIWIHQYVNLFPSSSVDLYGMRLGCAKHLGECSSSHVGSLVSAPLGLLSLLLHPTLRFERRKTCKLSHSIRLFVWLPHLGTLVGCFLGDDGDQGNELCA